MNRKVKKIICATSIITDEQWNYEEIKDNLLGILLSFKNKDEIQYKNWNKIVKKEFEENDIDFIFKFRLEKNDKND